MKGETLLIGGNRWTVVDAAPAEPLAEMVAEILKAEGIPTLVRGPNVVGEALSTLGSYSLGPIYVLVPEAEATRAGHILEETVTDYEGEELEKLLDEMADADEEEPRSS